MSGLKIFIWITLALIAARTVYGFYRLGSDAPWPDIQPTRRPVFVILLVGRVAWLALGITLLREMYR